METNRYDRIAGFYRQRIGAAIDETAATLLDLMGDVRDQQILDLACGQGRVTRELARRGARVTGVDISDVMLESARAAEVEEPLGITYLKANVTSAAALAGQTFEGVACSHGLADIDDLDGVLAMTTRVLRPGGRLVFSILHPCFPGWDDEAPSSWPPDAGYHAEGWWLAGNSGLRGKVGSNHRTLSTYLNSLVRHRLTIEKAAEPLDPRSRSRQLAAQPGAGPIPMFLVVRCRRLSEPPAIGETPARDTSSASGSPRRGTSRPGWGASGGRAGSYRASAWA